jgi:cobalt-zinc-cadmium efflux system membrane fusion protein
VRDDWFEARPASTIVFSMRATDEAGVSHHPHLTRVLTPKETTAPPRRSRKRLALVLGGLIVVGGGAALFLRGGKAGPEPRPAATADVPRAKGDRITYSPAFATRAQIQVTEVKEELLQPAISLVGTVDFNASHVAAIGTRLRGLVSRVDKYEGDSVKAGESLALVQSAELGEAQAAVSMLQAEYEAAEINAKREAALAERKLTTAREVEVASVEARKSALKLEAARQKVAALGGAGSGSELGSRIVRSPIAGTVVERNVAPGQFVDGDLVAFKVADLEHLWIELDVFERNLPHVHVGDRAELKPLTGGAALQGTVAKVASTINPETHSAIVRIEVSNRDRKLRVGQAVKATLHSSGTGQAHPVVPTSAITFVDGKPTVFVATGPGEVAVTRVMLGANDSARTEILSGLKAGDRVVTGGVFSLKSELFR